MNLRKRSRKRHFISSFFVPLLLLLVVLTPGTLRGVDPGLSSFAASPASYNFQTSSLYPLPKSAAPASTLDIVQSGGKSPTIGYTLAALEGIVARTQPQIFLTNSQDDQFWLNYIEQNYGLKVQKLTQTQALQQFGSYVKNSAGKVKIILFDSKDPLSPMELNIAVTLAGVYTALPVASGDLATIQSVYGASNIETLYNIHGNFTDKVSGYTWLWNLVHNKVTKSFLTLYPEPRVGITDYLVEFQSMIFEFSTSSAMTSSETALANTITSAYAPNTPVMGFFGLGGEVPTIDYLTSKQLLMQPGESVSDLSVFSGLPDDRNLIPITTPSVTYNPSTTYVVFIFSQGTAIDYDYAGNLHTWNVTDPATNKPYRSEVPVTFQINPVLAELAPPILKYWYSSMYPSDTFTTGGSGGAGYVHPADLPNEASFVKMSDVVDNNIGLVDQFIITGQFQMSSFQSWIADGSPPQAIYCWKQNQQSAIVSGVPVITAAFWAPSSSTLSMTDVNNAISQIKAISASGNHFIYISMNAQNEGLPYVKDVLNGLGNGFEGVNAVQFGQLFLAANK
jgi:hypothetical protein